MKTRLDWLEDQLDRDDLDEATRAAYEKEANKLADKESAMQEKRVEYQQQLQDKINKIKGLRGQTQELFDLYGHEFIDDYEVSKEGNEYIVYSYVARDFQETRWPQASELDAHDKVVQLIGWRIYNHYVREQ